MTDSTMTTAAPQTFVREIPVIYVGAKGRKTHGIEYCHSTRSCSNCAHYGPHDAEWVADGGLDDFGSCMNMCGAADSVDEQHKYCPSHQTCAEFDGDVHRPHRPVLALVATTE